MSAFPPKRWEVRFLQDMETLQCSQKEGQSLSMEAYVAVKPSGGQEGNFRFTLAGTEKIKLEFAVSRILPDPVFKDMFMEIELAPGDQIKLEKNSACSTWWDVEDLVASQDVVVTNGKGRDMAEEFLTAVGHDKTLVSQSSER